MTLCIAAVSRRDNTIVTASDLMMSTDYMSKETMAIKVEPISPSRRWIMMFAGTPSPISAIQLGVKARLEGRAETETEIVEAVQEVYRDEVRRKIEGEILSPYGLDREQFFRLGREYFGDEEFLRIVYQVNACKLGIDLIIAGFEPNGFPRIFSVADPGTCEHHERIGFHAIGTGYLRALASLYTTYDAQAPKTPLVYRLCEAKFLGESALGVGKNTYVLTLAPDGTYETMYPKRVEELRPLWERDGKPPIPAEALQLIEKHLSTTVWQKPTAENPVR